MVVRRPPAALVAVLFLTTCNIHGSVGGRDRRQATEATPTGPIKSYKQFINLTKLEAEKQELPAGFGSYDFPDYEQNEIVDRHNLLRRTPAARNEAERNNRGAIKSSDMEHMSRDTDLEYMALQWARGCDFSHGQPPNVSPYDNLGQNLWAYTGREDEPRSGVRATQDWYDEVLDYYYREQDGGSCSGVCGHYTQVVWASTNKIGCGRYFCPFLTSANLANAWYVVCNYAPAGNFYGLPPYALGSPCTECASGVGQCYNDLCRPCSEHREACDCRQTCVNCGRLNRATCSCNCPDGYYGSSCSKQCIDTSYRCYNTWWPQFCADYPDVREGCPQMCGLCNPADPDFVCDPTNQTPAPPIPPVRPTSAPVDPRPALCDMKFTAATYISGVLHLFLNDRVWRVRSNRRLRSPVGGELATDYFRKLPNKASCAYELHSGEVVFVRGKKMFKYAGSERTAVYTLSSLGLPKGLTGAIHVSSESKTYFFKGSEVYAFNERTRRVESGYPRGISQEFPGVPNKIISAFSDVSGNKYFVRSRKVHKISSGRNNVDRGYPKFFTDTFIADCAK